MFPVPDGVLMIQAEAYPSLLADRCADSAARIGTWEIDIAQDRAVWSDALCAILGWPPGSRPSVGEGLGDCHPDDRAATTAAFRIAMARGEPVELETRMVRRLDGRTVWLRISAEPQMREGRCIGLRGTTQDITATRAGQADVVAHGVTWID